MSECVFLYFIFPHTLIIYQYMKSILYAWILYILTEYNLPGAGILHIEWGSGIAQLDFYHCRGPAWGTPPVAKVMRKEARHTQRRDWASGVPWKFSSIYPENQSLPTFCFVLSPTPLTLRGAVPHYLSLKKVSLQLQLIIPGCDSVST